MFNRQSLIAIGAAILLGLAPVYLANVFLSSSEQRVAEAEAGTTRIAVAAVALGGAIAGAMGDTTSIIGARGQS